MSLKSKIRSKKMERLCKNNGRTVLFPDLKQIRSVGVVMDLSHAENNRLLLDLKKRLTPDCPISILRIDLNTKTKASKGNLLTKADLDFWGLPKVHTIEHFTSKQFDVLFNFMPTENDVVDCISALSKARFKVAAYAKGSLYDLMVQLQPEDVGKMINEFFRIIENLKNRN